MKKLYIDPAMEVIKMETMSVLADSKTATISGSQSNAAALGREYDFDDDWDE